MRNSNITLMLSLVFNLFFSTLVHIYSLVQNYIISRKSITGKNPLGTFGFYPIFSLILMYCYQFLTYLYVLLIFYRIIVIFSYVLFVIFLFMLNIILNFTIASGASYFSFVALDVSSVTDVLLTYISLYASGILPIINYEYFFTELDIFFNNYLILGTDEKNSYEKPFNNYHASTNANTGNNGDTFTNSDSDYDSDDKEVFKLSRELDSWVKNLNKPNINDRERIRNCRAIINRSYLVKTELETNNLEFEVFLRDTFGRVRDPFNFSKIATMDNEILPDNSGSLGAFVRNNYTFADLNNISVGFGNRVNDCLAAQGNIFRFQ